MAWYYVSNGTSQGPISEPELRHLRDQNVVAADTPVWTEGMPEWLPFQNSALATLVAAGSPPAMTHACAECGRIFPEDEMLQYENSWVCATCKPVFFQRIKEGVQPKGVLPYATVGRRFLAIMLDGLILIAVLFVPIGIITMLVLASSRNSGNPGSLGWWFPALMVIEYGVPIAYEIFFIGRYGATPGKMIMKVRVVSPDGGKISYMRAAGRYFAKILSGIILYIGFIMAFWDDEKKALHDIICQTRVINTEA